ncbi:Hypothetical protein FKW44_022645, partial [Caligus rogercresseyi]
TNKPVLLSAAARYAVLDLKIPSPSTDSWTPASKEVKFFPSLASIHQKTISTILKHFK